MRHMNYYNKNYHKVLSQIYFFRKASKTSYKKYPVLKQKRSTRLILKPKNTLKRFVYSNIKYKRDKRKF